MMDYLAGEVLSALPLVALARYCKLAPNTRFTKI